MAASIKFLLLMKIHRAAVLAHRFCFSISGPCLHVHSLCGNILHMHYAVHSHVGGVHGMNIRMHLLKQPHACLQVVLVQLTRWVKK